MRTRGRKNDISVEDYAGSDGNRQLAKTSPASPASSSRPTSPTVVRLKKTDTPRRSRAPPPSTRPSRLPRFIQFPLVLVLNIGLSGLASALAYPYTKAVIASHERPLETWNEAAIMVSWRIVELALGWFGNYDSYDLTAMNILSHGPPLYLLYAFYEVPAPALLLSLAIETLATYIPFRLLRPLSAAHAEPQRAPNAEIVTDRSIALLTTLLAGAIYSVTLLLAYATYLPTYLVVHFRDLPTVAAARPEGAQWVGDLLPAALALGFAARAFVFASAGAAPPDLPRMRRVAAFDPATASLGETLRWNVWGGWSDAARAAVRRTVLLALVTGVNAFLHARLAVRGVETPGAAAWAAVWVVAAALTGSALGLVGSV